MKITSNRFFLFYLILGAFCLNACQSQNFYEKYYDLPNSEWSVDSVLSFDFEIKEVQKTYNFYYFIRNSISYPYSNLYVNFYLENSQGEILDKELQNITLFNAKTGKPFGAGLGDIFSHELPPPKLTRYTFPKPGKYTFKLKQYMREDPIKGMITMGLIIQEVK